jgi:ureidoacrylate peracid hydrolase
VHKVHIPQDVIDRVIARQGRQHTYETLDPAMTALLVVDMLNYFMAAGELACCPDARDIVPNVNRLAFDLAGSRRLDRLDPEYGT